MPLMCRVTALNGRSIRLLGLGCDSAERTHEQDWLSSSLPAWIHSGAGRRWGSGTGFGADPYAVAGQQGVVRDPSTGRIAVSAPAKPGKSKRKPESAAETLDQLESLGDRLGTWIAENAMLLMGLAVLILLLAGGYGLVHSHREAAREAASAGLAKVENAYLSAMGGSSATL